MRKQNVLKKLISSILVAIIVLGQFSGISLVSKAATITTEESDVMYLSLSKTNKDGENPIGYQNENDKIIWNIMHSTDSAGTDEVASSNIYCIKAEDGETWGENPTGRVEYNWSTSLDKDLKETPSDEVNALISGEYLNEILWIIDNMYVPGESDKNEFLAQSSINYVEGEGYTYTGTDYSNIAGVSDAYGEDTLTEDDIIAIQQSAIWYFTNHEDANYNLIKTTSWLHYTTDGEIYQQFRTNKNAINDNEPARNAHSYVLFNYFIDEAINATKDLENNTYELTKTTAKLWLSTTTEKDNEEQPVIEVHKIKEEYTEIIVEKVWDDNQNEDGIRPTSVKVQLYANGEKQGEAIELNSENSWSYTWGNILKKSNGEDIRYTVKEINAAGEEVQNGGNYNLNYKTEYLEENTKTTITNQYIPEKTFDLSLRKLIAEIKDSKGNIKNIANIEGQDATREVLVNTTLLDSEDTTTAEYKHRKDPVVVETGDTVKYAITIYNEGEQDGYASVIKDQLPGTWGKGLRLQTNSGTVQSSNGNIYKVEYDTTNNIVVLTMTEESPKNVLEAYKTEEELKSETIYIECKVMGKPDASLSKILTNIAYISQDYNAETQTILDRDSKPSEYPQKSGNTLITDDLGYTGKETETDLSDSNKYYKGEQDDDDFEKVVILPESFDLSLRKNITKVNGEDVTNTRIPNPITTNLNVDSTTAEYNHRKDAVLVENGDTVEYNITIYNEGSIDGIATIIKDQLPTGLKLDLDFFTKEGEEYFTTSSNKNTYKVTYDLTNNIVIFTLDETQAVTLLEAYTDGEKLDNDIITLRCKVDCQADDEQNLFLTNIAYIYEAKQEDGTIVTDQRAGTDKASEADRDSQPYTHPEETADELKTIGDLGYTGKNTETDLSNSNKYYIGEQDDDDFEKLVLLPKTFDLKLIKFITELNGENTANRVISIDTSKLNTTPETTAEYILEKNPISVKGGDFVTYTLRVYNEGHYDGYATQISENIPEGLEFLVVTDTAILSWDGKEQKDITEEIKKSNMYEKILAVNSNWGYNTESSVITTKALSEDLLKGFGKENVQYVDTENNIDYAEVQVIFRVKDNVEANQIIRNEAAITEDKAVEKDGTEIDISDRDSKPDEWKKENSNKNYDEEGKWPIYKEDDEDYDNIITKTFDLSLRKQIIQINSALYTNRYPKLDTEGAYSNTIYTYYDVYSNKPKVKAGDKVVYSIRVYNEGEIDGYADLIVDSLPSGLEFVKDSTINIQYGWILVEGIENQYQTDYLSYEKDQNKGTSESTIIKAYDGKGQANFQEVLIECRVKENATKEDSLLNVAQIAEDSDLNGDEIKDKDSIPGTTDNEEKWKVEDDLDIEILELQEFDLALRKFITAIENGENLKEITTRIPQVNYDEEAKQLVYTHIKDALIVHVGDTVIYTLRVYNEGDIDGYASEIKDDIPEYLEYLPEHAINKANEWVMYDKDGKITENVEEAVCIRTEHLAEGKGVEADEQSKETNLIKAFDVNKQISSTNPDYKDIQVAFKVKDPNSTEYEIINFAQISEDSDSKGEPIDDRDSKPNNGETEPKEDDEDIEKVKVQYFDLSLLKYVTKVLVNENGVERVIETGNVGDENDIIPHVQINKKNIDKTVVKFVYSIKITNEGQIAGEATEITDYVPEGLVFVAEDNEHWTDEGNNIISTKQLTGSIIQPGESVEVEVVLRWINGANNLGAKTNIAEISEDYNTENVEDRDSTPDNKKEGEDDIDDATVLLSVNQGGGIPSLYINLIITFLSIILVGAILIKKFVL